MSYRFFTADEDAYLVQHYADMTLVAMAGEVNRSWQCVQQRVEILIRRGILHRHQRYYARPWTEDEHDWLLEHWGMHSDEYVAAHLGRTVNACKIRATKHAGVGRKANYYTAEGVARLFGIDSGAVRRWITAGILAAHRSPVRCGPCGFAWMIPDEALEAFIRNSPWHYDRARIEKGTWWRNLAEKVWQKNPWLTTKEAARELGVHSHTLCRHLQQGWLRGEKTWEAGKWGGWRIPRSALAAWYTRSERRA